MAQTWLLVQVFLRFPQRSASEFQTEILRVRRNDLNYFGGGFVDAVRVEEKRIEIANVPGAPDAIDATRPRSRRSSSPCAGESRFAWLMC